jgi:RNA polymerase sigma factor for flagellar operon FliA
VPCVDPLSLLPAIRRAAWRLHARLPASVDHDDLVQSGLLRVLERQRRTQDDAAGYLLIVARSGMLDYLRSMDPLHHTERLAVRRLAEARDRAERRMMRSATSAEVAAEAGVPIKDAARACDVSLCGLDEAADVSADQPDPADALAALYAVREAARRYQRLDGKCQGILDDWLAERPQVETAAELGVTPGRVTQLRQRALERVVG